MTGNQCTADQVDNMCQRPFRPRCSHFLGECSSAKPDGRESELVAWNRPGTVIPRLGISTVKKLCASVKANGCKQLEMAHYLTKLPERFWGTYQLDEQHQTSKAQNE